MTEMGKIDFVKNQLFRRWILGQYEKIHLDRFPFKTLMVLTQYRPNFNYVDLLEKQ